MTTENTTMEKLAALPASQQLGLMSSALEKTAAERDGLMAKLAQIETKSRVDELFHRLEETGQNQWGSRESCMEALSKLSSADLGSLEATMRLLPGALGKVASGLTSETLTDGDGRKPDLEVSRKRFIAFVEGGGQDE